MKVKIALTVEIDREAWIEDYAPDDVRLDVKACLEAAVEDWLTQRDLGRVVT